MLQEKARGPLKDELWREEIFGIRRTFIAEAK